jgi:pimeloyl-ACP methyl ester carboxylesterase
MHRRTRIAIAAVAIAVAACGTPAPTPSPSTPPSPSAAPPPPPTPSASLTRGDLRWLALGDSESTTVTVPLDYRDGSAGTIKLAVVRRRSPGPTTRIGTLLLNPGGPGGSGVQLLALAESALPPDVVERFDLVSWDPRGVGFSHGVTCPDASLTRQVQGLDPDPTTPAAEADYKAVFDQIAAACEAQSGDILPYLSAANSARDMEAIRAAMGEATISYWGWSYGTYLGYLYATMFPTRLRAMVLDGPVDPTLDLAGRDLGQARGFEAAFDHDLELCAASSACPFYNGGQPGAAYTALLASLATKPLSVAGIGTLGPGEAETGVLASLYSGDPWSLMSALAAAQGGDGTVLLAFAGGLFGQSMLGSYLATTCLDVARLPTPAAIDAALAAARTVAPRFAGQVVLSDGYGCLDWPVPADPAPVAAPPTGLPPVLVLAGSYDPATPPWMAEPLARALGSGVVLQRDGLGHTSESSIQLNTCLSDAASAYVLRLEVPAPGTVCQDDPFSF